MGKSYRDLVAWQKAMLLVTEIYGATKTFPAKERMASRTSFGGPPFRFQATLLRDRRDSARGIFTDFSGTARGSLVEIKTQVEIANGRILNGLLASIKTAA